MVFDSDPKETYINLQLMEHISPITWYNVILYEDIFYIRGLSRFNSLSGHEDMSAPIGVIP